MAARSDLNTLLNRARLAVDDAMTAADLRAAPAAQPLKEDVHINTGCTNTGCAPPEEEALVAPVTPG